MSDEIATRSIQRPRSTPVAALRATEKRSIPPSLNGQIRPLRGRPKIFSKADVPERLAHKHSDIPAPWVGLHSGRIGAFRLSNLQLSQYD